MDLKLKPFDFSQAVARAGLARDGTPLAPGGAGAVKESGFQNAMAQALKSVSDQQREAEGLQRELQLGNSSVSLEETMISMQKAQIGFQAALTVRNRFVQAYTDIMNMQV
ncbi:MAG: flagellar hook-basal body complex protein FliE [Vitreoscilla sp.]|jgi:flagellar hook-basal body complex protein FliE|nr:flagellar hook-basal body complex protein FliE [Vitreoscilla sp.]